MSLEESRSSPLFSVIVPTHDRPAFLREALESVAAQSITDFECIVVDDGSEQPVGELSHSFARVVRRSHPGGPAAARNAGVREAKGRYLTFLDDDDCWLPERLEIALEGLERAPLTICWRADLDDPQGPIAGRRLEGEVHDCILDQLTPHIGETAIAADRWLPFDESYPAAEDVEWWLRITAQCSVSTVERVGQLYRTHGGPRPRHGKEARVHGGLQLLENHRDYFESHPRAAAMRWKRIGLTAIQMGDRALARKAFARSLRRSPSVRTATHLLGALAVPRVDRSERSFPEDA